MVEVIQQKAHNLHNQFYGVIAYIHQSNFGHENVPVDAYIDGSTLLWIFESSIADGSIDDAKKFKITLLESDVPEGQTNPYLGFGLIEKLPTFKFSIKPKAGQTIAAAIAEFWSLPGLYFVDHTDAKNSVAANLQNYVNTAASAQVP